VVVASPHEYGDPNALPVADLNPPAGVIAGALAGAVAGADTAGSEA
jgi:hypothetical protein